MQSDERISARLTLVSASPRRRDILREAGFTFDILPTQVAEVWNDVDPAVLAEQNAERKVRASNLFLSTDRILLGADTIVCLGSRVFGKPVGADSARRMLRALSGRAHHVITGVCLSGPDRKIVTDSAQAVVHFQDLSPEDIRSYIESREWRGKAGAYAIQGLAGRFVRELTGDIQTVVGLPMDLFHELLTRHFSHCRIQ